MSSASGEAVGRAAGSIYCRLFDHRPAVQGEVRYFVKEFETKRGNKDIDRLKRCVNEMQEVQQTYLPESAAICKNYLTVMHQKVAEVSSFMEDAMKVEDKAEKTRAAKHAEHRKDFDATANKFHAQLSEKYRQIDLEFERAIAEYKNDLDNRKV
eukprot:m.834 g.834  ORF g.834 m.834 type:complete len:154 (+) comp4972_c0_seq2:113-574(+)